MVENRNLTIDSAKSASVLGGIEIEIFETHPVEVGVRAGPCISGTEWLLNLSPSIGQPQNPTSLYYPTLPSNIIKEVTETPRVCETASAFLVFGCKIPYCELRDRMTAPDVSELRSKGPRLR